MLDHGNDTSHYLLSKLYVDDYCCWIQKAPDKALAELAGHLEEVGAARRAPRLLRARVAQAQGVSLRFLAFLGVSGCLGMFLGA